MGQVTIYLENDIEEKLTRAARAAGLSKSRWVAGLIKARVASEWPASVRALAGSWSDQPPVEIDRKSLGRDAKREPL